MLAEAKRMQVPLLFVLRTASLERMTVYGVPERCPLRAMQNNTSSLMSIQSWLKAYISVSKLCRRKHLQYCLNSSINCRLMHAFAEQMFSQFVLVCCVKSPLAFVDR